MSISRRNFLKTTGLAAGAASTASLLPAGLLAGCATGPAATPPPAPKPPTAFTPVAPASIADGQKLRLAIIGCGGQGGGDLGGMASHPRLQLVAACDPDKSHREGFAKRYGEHQKTEVKAYSDYRNLFHEMKGQIDGVLVATPDHMHAPIDLLAMSLGIHVYGQKPLARTIGECRAITEMAAKTKVITQMGIQIHSDTIYQTTRKWIREGVIGKVKSISSNMCGNKPWGGIVKFNVGTAPESMDWDRYIGVSKGQPWSNQIHPMDWRKWASFGSGIQGDMACHVFDPVYMATGITSPTKVVSFGPLPPEERFFAFDNDVEYTFPGTEFTAGDIKLRWRSGNIYPPKGMHPGIEAPTAGSLIIGEKGALKIPHMAFPTVVDAKGNKIERKDLPAAAPSRSHYHDWIDAVLANDQSKATAGFAYSGPMTEAVLMGLAINHAPNKEFTWDAANCRFAGVGKEVEKANALVHPTYREGWTAPGM